MSDLNTHATSKLQSPIPANTSAVSGVLDSPPPALLKAFFTRVINAILTVAQMVFTRTDIQEDEVLPLRSTQNTFPNDMELGNDSSTWAASDSFNQQDTANLLGFHESLREESKEEE